MNHWLHYNLEHPIAIATFFAMIPMVLMLLAARRRRKLGLTPYVAAWQSVVMVLVLVGLCVVGVFAKL